MRIQVPISICCITIWIITRIYHHHMIMCCRRSSGTWRAPTTAGPTRPPLPPQATQAPGRAACAGINTLVYTHPPLVALCSLFSVHCFIYHVRCVATGGLLFMLDLSCHVVLSKHLCTFLISTLLLHQKAKTKVYKVCHEYRCWGPPPPTTTEPHYQWQATCTTRCISPASPLVLVADLHFSSFLQPD